MSFFFLWPIKHHINDNNAAKENLPAPNTKGLAVSNKYDITGQEEPQKKTVEKTA